MIDRFERFSFAISEISRCWHRIAGDVMSSHGLKGPYAVYFTAMYRYPEGITAVQLGEICSRDKADVSRAMQLMEQRGLIEKQVTDKRTYRALLKLTPEGIALAQTINQKAILAVETASAGLSPEKRAIFYEALELITANLQQMSKSGLPEEKQ